jgi:hypothetical protein
MKEMEMRGTETIIGDGGGGCIEGFGGIVEGDNGLGLVGGGTQV